MLRIDVINDGTGTRAVGNYRYYVYVTDTAGNLREIARGEIKNHTRSDNWYVLTELAASDGRKQWLAAIDRMIDDNKDIWAALADQ